MSRSSPNPLLVSVLVLVWWLANNLYAIDAHLILHRYQPTLLFIDLCSCQILVGMLMSLAIKRIKRVTSAHSTHTPSHLSLSLFRRTLFTAGLFHFVGTTFTNASYRLLGSTPTLVWKLAEPLTSVALKYVVLHETTNMISFFGILTVVYGVMVFSKDSMTAMSLSPIIVANLAYPTRNVVLKLDQKSNPNTMTTTEDRYFILQASALPFCLLALVYKISQQSITLSAIPYLFWNAFLFNSYQFASISLLEILDALTHSLANTLKRFTGIILSVIVIGQQITSSHIFGFILTMLGFPLYVFGGKIHLPTQFPRIHRNVIKSIGCIFLVCFIISTNFISSVSVASLKDFQLFRASSPSIRVSYPPSNSTEKSFGANHVVRVLPQRKPLEIIFRDYEHAKSTQLEHAGFIIRQFAAVLCVADFSTVRTCNHSRAVCAEKFPEESERGFVTFRATSKVMRQSGNETLFFESSRSMQTSNDVLLFVSLGVRMPFRPDLSFDSAISERNTQNVPEKFEISQGDEMLLQALQKRRMPTFMHGAYSVQVAQKAGYFYGVSTGCPSLMISRDVRLGERLQKRYERLGKRIGDTSVKVAVSMNNEPETQRVVLDILNNYPKSLVFASDSSDVNTLHRLGVPFHRVRVYSSIGAWQKAMQEMDIAIGVRLEMNMLAIAEGVPAFVVAVDHGVMEMAQRMLVPHSTIHHKFLRLKNLDIVALTTRYKFDGPEFDKNRCEIARLYKRTLMKLGIQVAPHVAQLCELC